MEDDSAFLPQAYLAELQRAYQGPDKIPPEGTTTLMIRNLPRSYTPTAIMCELKTLCPSCRYDFVYLPWDKRRSSNISFAFLNFVDADSCMRAFFAISGQAWNLVRSLKICRVAAAHIQGLRENLANYVTTVVDWGKEEGPHPPIVIQDGIVMDLKEAVATLCTEEMLRQASKSNQPPWLPSTSSSWSGPYSGVAPDSDRNSEQSMGARDQRDHSLNALAKEFRESFLEFCQGIASDSRARGSYEVDSAGQGEVANVDFWINFHSLCLQFSEAPSMMPDVQVPQPAVHGFVASQLHRELPRNANVRQGYRDVHERMLEQVSQVHQYSHHLQESREFATVLAPGHWLRQPRMFDPRDASAARVESRLPPMQVGRSHRFSDEASIAQATFGSHKLDATDASSIEDSEIPIPSQWLTQRL